MSRPLIALAGVAVAGIAIAGVGAGATFTSSTSSDQTISSGTIGVSITAPGSDCTDVGQRCTTLTLPAVGPVGSTFETTPTVVKMTNTGNIPATFDAIQMSETHDGSSSASNHLLNEMNVCIRSTDDSGGPWNEGNGPLTTAVALTPTVKENPVVLAPGGTATYQVDFYAGKDSACGTNSSDGTHTKAAWDGYDGGTYHTPASLNNDAMGGSVTPTLTFSFTA
jgi:hypothetical protein